MTSPPFLERHHELESLSEMVDGLARSGGRVALVRGEAGIGKSTLIREFARVVGDRVRVHIGTCDDLMIAQPLGPFWDMARAEPALRPALEAGDRPRLLRAVLELLGRERPTILAFEDTHWADEATLDAIRYVGRRIETANGAMILTFRDGDLDDEHPLRGVIGDLAAERVTRIRLRGLSLAAVSTLTTGSDLDAVEVLASTGGNPFLVRELTASAGDGEAASLHDAVMARMRRLPATSQDALRTLAVVPQPIARVDACRISGIDEASLDDGIRRELLDASSDEIRFRHELIRRTIEMALSTSDRIARNRAVLEALPQERYASLLIHCAVEAGAIDQLLELAPVSARYAAATGSHVQAVRDYRALQPYLDRLDPDELAALLEDWAREEHLVDNVAEAIRLNRLAGERYREVGDTSSESRTVVATAHWYELVGRHHEAVSLGADALAVLGPDPEPDDLVRVLEVNAYLHAMAGDRDRALELVASTLDAMGPGPDDNIVIRSLNHRGFVVAIADYPMGRDDLEEARHRAQALGNRNEEVRADINLGWAAAEHHDIAAATEILRRAIATAARHELRLLERLATAEFARLLEMRGEWVEASDLARGLLDTAAVTRMLAVPVLGSIESRRARPTAWDYLEQAWAVASVTAEFHRVAPAAIALAEHAWLHEDPRVDLDALEEALALGLDQGYRWSTGKLALRLWMLGRSDGSSPGLADPYAAMLDGDVRTAAEILSSQDVPYELAIVLMHGGRAEQLQALELLEAVGADRVAAKLRRSLRDRGVSVPRGKGRETRRNRAGLTARQAEVVTLLAEGLTNAEIADRLFISPRTAEHHVSAVLDKLDATTREDAADWARREGLDRTVT